MRTIRAVFVFCALLCANFVVVEISEASFASKLDEVFSAIVGNSFRKAGKNIDEFAILRKADGFDAVIRKNDDLLRGSSRRADDLADIGFPRGSRYIDDFLELGTEQRRLGGTLDDVSSRIAKLQNASDIVETVGPRGLLLGARYGDDVVDNVYKIAKNDEVWRITKTSAEELGRNADELKRLSGTLVDYGFKDSNFSSLRRIQNGVSTADIVGQSEAIVKKYGPTGLRNINDALNQLVSLVTKHPRKIAIGALVGVVYFNPETIIDPAGKLTKNFSKIVNAVLVEATTDTVTSVVEAPYRVSEKLTERWLGNAPEFVKTSFTWGIMIFIVLLLMSIFPFTRFISLGIVGSVKKLWKGKAS